MNAKLRILHVEDSKTDCELIRQMLVNEGIDCEVMRRDTYDSFLADLQKKEFDLILSDSSLPEFSGLRALELAHKHAPEIPFIFVSGTMGEEMAIESLRNGATDYVLKHRLSRLVPAVQRAVAEAAERAKNREMEQRLRQAQRLEAVGNLAGGVAHDFNNILNIIKGHVALLRLENQPPERMAEIASTIEHASQRGTDLVKQLLAFARKSDVSFSATNINQLVRQIEAMAREAMPRNITFKLVMDDGLPEIQADPGQLERVILNLATNARDAMPEGGRIIFTTCRVRAEEMRVRPTGDSEEYLCLRVTDTGIGMDEATRQQIFEPFFTTKPRGQGTGLGMPVVYGLMESHNGLIDVQSQLGKGTSIALFFPIPKEPITKAVEAPATAAKSVKGTETILVVDDEPDVLNFVEIILQSHGYNVVTAHDAEEALYLLEVSEREIHLLFSDLGLPRLDGFGLSSRAKSLKPRLKTILTSGYADGTLKAKLSEMKIDGFIPKPYDSAIMLETIRATLDKEERA